VQKSLSKAGHSSQLYGFGANINRISDDDVVLRITGRFTEDPVPGFPNILWIISHPEYILPNLVNSYQKVFIASRSLYEHGIQNAKFDWAYLPQATDPDIFAYNHRSDTSGRISFVANTRYRDRNFYTLTRNSALPVTYVGRGWEKRVSAEQIEAEYIPNTKLAQHYAHHGFVLCDQFTTMTTGGLTANRVFDVLSCGAHPVVIRPNSFPEELKPYVTFVRNRPELESDWNDWQNRDLRITAEKARKAADIVSQNYTFDVVTKPIIQAAEDTLQQQSVAGYSVKVPQSDQNLKLSENTPIQHICLSDCENLSCGHTSGEEFISAEKARAIADSQQPFSVTLQLSERLCQQKYVTQEQALHIVAQRISSLLRVIPIVEEAQNFQVLRSSRAALSALCDHCTHSLPINHLTATYNMLADDLENGTPRRNITEAIKRLSQYARRVPSLDAPWETISKDRTFRISSFILPFALHDLAAMHGQHAKAITEDITKSHYSLPGRKSSVQLKRPVGIFIHAYYTDLLDHLLKATACIPKKSIYISTDVAAKAKIIERKLQKYQIKDYEVRVTPNIGRDIYPKLIAFADVYDQHDFVLHLHTKKSAHSKKATDWLDMILDDILPDPEAINRILSLFLSIPDLGIIAPRPPKHLTGGYRWTVNKHIARAIFPQMKLPEDGEFVFPMGSMFWARTDALRPLLDAKLTAADFPPEAKQLDGTTAHAIERLIGVCAMDAGYHVIKYSGVNDNRYRKYRTRLRVNKDLLHELSAVSHRGSVSNGKSL